MTPDFDTVVVGAGVVGLAIGRAIAARNPGLIVLERNARIASETSARSSEVIHAGLYYPPGSLKARLCVAGRKLLYAYAREHAVAVRRLGKLVVATDPDEVPALERIAATAITNGVDGIRLLSRAEAEALEPALRCEAALLSPESGVVDSAGLAAVLEAGIAAAGGMVVCGTSVEAITHLGWRGFALETLSGTERARVTTRTLVLAGGLGATRLGRMLSYRDDYEVPETYLAKGHYFSVSGRTPFSRLIYPLPSAGGLGIHLTLDVSGAAKLGPDVSWVDRIDYAFDDATDERRSAFLTSVKRFWPSLSADRLFPLSTGIRPKLTRAGKPAADFAIHGPGEHAIPGLVALYGIESPGLTASLAIGEYVAELVGGEGQALRA